MSRFLIQASYTAEAIANMTRNPEDRGTAVKAMMEKLGGRVLDVYFCLGEYDVIVLIEAPDEKVALAGLLAAHTPGHLKGTKTTLLFTMEEAMGAMAMAGALAYAGPKG